MGDVAAVHAYADAVIELADQHSLNYWRLSGLILRGWAMAQEGAVEDGLALMRQSLIDRNQARSQLVPGSGICACWQRHTFSRARATRAWLRSTEAKDLAARNDEQMWEAELARIRANCGASRELRRTRSRHHL